MVVQRLFRPVRRASRSSDCKVVRPVPARLSARHSAQRGRTERDRDDWVITVSRRRGTENSSCRTLQEGFLKQVCQRRDAQGPAVTIPDARVSDNWSYGGGCGFLAPLFATAQKWRHPAMKKSVRKLFRTPRHLIAGPRRVEFSLRAIRLLISRWIRAMHDRPILH